jgi:hypothetical protein
MTEHIIYLAAAIGFVAMPFRRSYFCAGWARWVCFTVAGLFVFMAVYGLALDLHYLDFSRHELSYIGSLMQAIRGFIIGCAFVLLVSGNIFRKKVLNDEDAA